MTSNAAPAQAGVTATAGALAYWYMRSTRESDKAKVLEIPEAPKTAPAAAAAPAKADKRRRGGRYKYPETRKNDHVDTYWDVQVPDPYQWLEGTGKACA